MRKTKSPALFTPLTEAETLHEWCDLRYGECVLFFYISIGGKPEEVALYVQPPHTVLTILPHSAVAFA